MTQTLIIGHMCCSTCMWKYVPPSLPAPFPSSTHWSPSKSSPSGGCETRPGALSSRGWLRRGTIIVWEDTVVTVTPAHHTPRLGTLIAIVGMTLQEQIKSTVLVVPPFIHNVLQFSLLNLQVHKFYSCIWCHSEGCVAIKT